MKIFKEFEGKTAFVTGAASGMGQAAAICSVSYTHLFKKLFGNKRPTPEEYIYKITKEIKL